MTYRTSLSVYVALLGTALAPLGCGSEDEPRNEATAGQSGAAGSAGSSGSGGSGAGTGGRDPSCDVQVGPIDPTTLIDDLEDGDGIRPGTMPGGWWVATDMSGGTIEPMADAQPLPERILGGRCGSEFAMRVTGEGFSSWGASLSLAFRYTTEQETIDASDFRGIRFWARTGEQHTSTVRVQFQDVNTYPNGGICNPEPGSADECYNGFGTDILPLDDQWRLYEIEFSRVTQRDFGLIVDALDTSQLYLVEFGMLPNTVFDFWVDDVWFYK